MLNNEKKKKINFYISNKDSDKSYIKIFGFWLYIMSDCILFSALFATYAVLKNNIAYGPSAKEIFNLPFVLIETLLLLFSSITYSIVTLNILKKNKIKIIIGLIITFLFGFIFICMEIYEIINLIKKGYGPDKSAFLSSFFTIISTHGIHIIVGLIWDIVMIFQIFYKNLIKLNKTRLKCLGLFWHFLDIIWICIFYIIYLLGVL